MRWIAALCLILLAGLALSACQPGEPEGSLPPVGERLIAVQQAQCEADGGTWGKIPDAEGHVCYRRTRDALKSCRVESDCESFCLARSRTCAPTVPFFGCHDVLTSSGMVSTVCVD